MKYITDTLLMAEAGLRSPYTTSAPSISPISGHAVMTNRVFPGLGTFLTFENQSQAIFYADSIENVDSVQGVLYPTTRASTDNDEEEIDYWLVQIESGYKAWQYMAPVDSVSLLSDTITLCEWAPGRLEDALALHNETLSELWDDEDLLVGSDLERKTMSQFSLASGATSLFHPLMIMGLLDQAKKAKGQPIFVGVGACVKMRSLPISWMRIT